MDLDKDGIKDILSGSARGNFYFFKGEGQGRFAEGQTLLDEKGVALRLGNYANVAVVDWNGDDAWDLACYVSGNRNGPLQLLIGVEGLRYRLEGPLPIDDQKLTYGSKGFPEIHDARLCFSDWNRDGVPDLLLGNGLGAVTFHPGTRNAAGELSLGAPQMLIAPFSVSEDDPLATRVTNFEGLELSNPRSGRRPTVSVTDWNGDGKLDLLVGDNFFAREDRAFTQEQQKQKSELEGRYRALIEETRKLQAEKGKQLLAELGKQELSELTSEEAQRYSADMNAFLQTPMMRRRSQEVAQVGDALAPFEVRTFRAGFVWVYLQK